MDQLRSLAAERRMSIAALLREAVGRLLEDAAATDANERALAAVGMFSWDGSGRDHDAELDDAFDS